MRGTTSVFHCTLHLAGAGNIVLKKIAPQPPPAVPQVPVRTGSLGIVNPIAESFGLKVAFEDLSVARMGGLDLHECGPTVYLTAGVRSVRAKSSPLNKMASSKILARA